MIADLKKSLVSLATAFEGADGNPTRCTDDKGIDMANLAADAGHAATQFAATLYLMGARFKDTSSAALPGLANLQLTMATSFGNPSSIASSRLAADPILDGDEPPQSTPHVRKHRAPKQHAAQYGMADQ